MKNIIKKRMDNLGRIVIPKSIRDELKIIDNEEFNIYVEDKKIILDVSSILKNNLYRLKCFQTFVNKYCNIDFILYDNNKNLILNYLNNININNDEYYSIIHDSFTLGYVGFSIYNDELCKEIVKIISLLIS